MIRRISKENGTEEVVDFEFAIRKIVDNDYMSDRAARDILRHGHRVQTLFAIYELATLKFGLCQVCGKQVMDQDEPVPVYQRLDDAEPKGYIHGSTDCSA
jgi:hypothetical protein